MKLATWNVNSLKVRLPQVLAWLDAHRVDALCLQELKLPDDQFPHHAFLELGYHAYWAGQKTYNGVAIISRQAGRDVIKNMPHFEDPQQRLIAATLPDDAGGEIRVICAYCPNGQALDSDKYQYKLAWYAALHRYLQNELQRYPRLAILGDYNIAPADEDVHDPEKWHDRILVSPTERHAFHELLALGLHDAFRLFEQPANTFSWWDYRQASFRRNAGLRIDHILLSSPLATRCQHCFVDIAPRRHTQPSDHAPLLANLAI